MVILVAASVVAIALFVGGVRRFFKPQTQTVDPRIVIAGAKATQNVNKDFKFPIMDAKGQEVTKLNFNVDHAPG